MQGISITFINQTITDTDPFGMPIYAETEETVDDVLVSPTTSTDLATNTDLTGKKLVYTLGIPKGDAHDWVDCKVKFFDKTFKSFGYPIEGIEANIPGKWHKKVMVELYE